MSLLNWVAPLVGLAGAALVAGANFFVQRWRYKIDRLSAAVGELSLEVNAAADIATHYWLLDTSQHPEQREARALETQLIGRQTRLKELVLALKAQDESQIGRAHVCTPVTNAHLVCRLLLEKKNKSKNKP